MKQYLRTIILGLLIAILLAQVAVAEAFREPIDVTGIESSHNYANDTIKSWTLSCPGADSITMTFDSRTEFESNYDFLYIYNASGTQIGKHSGVALASQTITVEGDSVELKLTSDVSVNYWGFALTQAYGTFSSSGGSGNSGNLGTESSPYLISNKEELNNIRNKLDAHYKLTANIVFTEADFASDGTFYNSGRGWDSIGTAAAPFTGSLDGDGYTITGLYQKRTTTCGLFGYIENAVIKNLGVVDATITASCSSYNGTSHAGAVAAYATNSIIAGCYHAGSTGQVKATVSASQTRCYAGGIVGYATATDFVSCYNAGTVYSGGSSTSGIDYTAYAGGIAAYVSGTTTISDCYHSGTVTASSGTIMPTSYAGGITAYSATSTLSRCYSSGTVKASASGIYADAYRGGIFGYKSSTTTDLNCYYLDTSNSGVGKGTDTATKCTEAQMKLQSTFVGFDFQRCWAMGDGVSYEMPVLQVRKLMTHQSPAHPACGAACNHTPAHGTMNAARWRGEAIVSGDYYLANNLQFSDMWTITGNVRLCLNGYSITFAEGTGLYVEKGASLYLCDCVGTGGIVRGPRISNGDCGIITNLGSMTVCGGIYCPDGEGVALSNDGTLTIYGGTFGIGLSNSGTAIIHDADFDLPQPKYQPWPSAIINSREASLTIYDGSFSAYGNAVRNLGRATATIRGGIFRTAGDDGLNSYACIDNVGTLYLHGGDIFSSNSDGIRNDFSYEHTSSGSTEYTGTLYVYGGTISALGENCAAISNRETLTVRGGTISGYIGIDNDSKWANTTQNGGTVEVYGGTISGTYAGICNGGGTSTQYTNGVVSGYLYSRGIVKISGSPSINSILLKYPEALELQYNGSDIIDLEVDFEDIKPGDILWKYSTSAMTKVNLVNEGYVLQCSSNGITVATDGCGANGNNLRWKLSKDGVLTIFGTGDMKNWDFSSQQPWSYSKTQIYVTNVILEPGVTSIGSAAFSYLSKLSELEIPEGVTKLNDWCLEGLTNLAVLKLPSTVTYIGNVFASWSLPSALRTITYSGCKHQWAQVKFGSNSLHFTPVCQQNANLDDEDFATDLLCSVCGGIDIAGIRGIEVTTMPDKLEYLEESALDVTGGKVTVYCNDGTSNEIDLTADMVTGFDRLAVGTQTVHVTYKGFTAAYAVTVNAKSLVSVKISTLPNKLTYIRGEEELDVTGGMLTLVYNNDTEEVVDLTAQMVSSIDHSQAGMQTVAVFYENLYDFFEISLIDYTAIEITALPGILSCLEGMPLDLRGGELTVSFSDGSTAAMAMEHSMLSYDTTAIGMIAVTVSYKGFTDQFEAEILAKSVQSIEVTPPTKTSYIEGFELLDLTDGKVTVYYNNNTQEAIELSNDMVTGFDNAVVGKQILTVSYMGATDTFEVTILEKTLLSIDMSVLPNQLVLVERTALDVTGGKIVLCYNNNTQEEIDLTVDMVTGFDNTNVGKQTLVVSYNGKTTTYDVEIVSKSVSSIAVITNPKRLTYIEGKIPLDVTGGKITVCYNNNTQEEIDMTADMVSGFDNTVVGTQTLTVCYGGFETTYDVTVNECVIRSTHLVPPAKLVYLEGSDLDLTGACLTVAYVSDDNYTEEIVLDSSMISGYNPDKTGVQVVTVTYEGAKVTFAVRVNAKTAVAIEVTPPTKISYIEGKGQLDVAGGKVTVYYNNNTQEEIDLTDDMVSGFDNAVVGKQTLTVSHLGFTAAFEIEIVVKPISVEILSATADGVRIAVENNPSAVCYAAVYDVHGKMLSFGFVSVAADAKEETIALQPFDAAAMHKVKVFLLDQQYAPLTAAKYMIVS